MEENREYEESISLLDVLNQIKNHLLFIIISVVTCVSIMGIYTFAIQKPEYVAKSSVIMSASGMNNSNGLSYGLNIVDTYKEFIVSTRVRQEMASKGYKDPYSINVTGSGTSLIVYIEITSFDGTYSVNVANEIINVANEVIFMNADGGMNSLAAAKPVRLDTAQRASSSLHFVRNTALGVAVGLVISALYVFIKMLLNNTFTKPDDLEKELGVPLLAATPYIPFESMNDKGEEVRKSSIK